MISAPLRRLYSSYAAFTVGDFASKEIVNAITQTAKASKVIHVYDKAAVQAPEGSIVKFMVDSKSPRKNTKKLDLMKR